MSLASNEKLQALCNLRYILTFTTVDKKNWCECLYKKKQNIEQHYFPYSIFTFKSFNNVAFDSKHNNKLQIKIGQNVY